MSTELSVTRLLAARPCVGLLRARIRFKMSTPSHLSAAIALSLDDTDTSGRTITPKTCAARRQSDKHMYVSKERSQL